MDAGNINLAIALVAGVLSFASPCVLPLVPGYLTFLAGTAVEGKPSRLRLFANSAAFVAGFTTVFVLLGALAGLVGYALQPYVPVLRQLGGVVLIVLGLHTAGVLRIPLLYRQWQPGSRVRLGYGRATAYVVGMIFAFGWTPCVGPVLGGILVLASTSDTAGQGALLLVVYSLGLGVPFLAAGLAADALGAWLHKVNRQLRYVEIIAGALLVAMGVLVFTGELARLSALLYPTS